jgi:hypothetical protein
MLELELDEPVDAIISTATLHWVTDHEGRILPNASGESSGRSSPRR